MNFFVPSDNQEMQERYQLRGGGTCGVAVLAVIKNVTIKRILQSSKIRYNGYLPLRIMRQMLEQMGYSTKLRGGKKSHRFPKPITDLAVVRIQWFDNNGQEFESFMEATKHTHYVLMKKFDDAWWIFCNGEGWFPKNCLRSMYYLEKGYVSSYLEIAPIPPTDKSVGILGGRL